MKDYFPNKSEISTDAKEKIWDEIAKAIEEESQDKQWKINQCALHQTLLFLLSSTYFNQQLYVIGESFSNNHIAEYVKTLRRGNTIETADVSKLMETVEALKDTDNNNLYSFLVVPYDVVNNPLLMEALEERTLTDSTIVIYNVPGELVLIFKYGKHTREKSEERNTLEERLHRLANCFAKGLKEKESQQASYMGISAESVDNMIRETFLAEKYANQHYQQIGIENIKDDLNEVKHALLDYRYGEDKDYFFEVIAAKMNRILVKIK